MLQIFGGWSSFYQTPRWPATDVISSPVSMSGKSPDGDGTRDCSFRWINHQMFDYHIKVRLPKIFVWSLLGDRNKLNTKVCICDRNTCTVVYSTLISIQIALNFNFFSFIFRNYDNVPLLGSCQFVKYLVSIGTLLTENVSHS